MLQHAHVQSLSKASGAGDQRDHILVLPPLPDEVCLVDIETICLNQLFKILMSDAYRFCRHAAPPVSRTIIAC